MSSILSKYLDSCNIYIFIWILWHTHGALYSNSTIAIMLYLPFMGMTLYYILKTIQQYQLTGVMRAFALFTLFLLPYSIGLLLFDDAQGQDRKSFLMMMIGSLCPIYAFYYMTKEGLLTAERMRSWFLPLFAVAVFVFYAHEQRILASLAIKSSTEEITNNYAYDILALAPFVFLFKKPIWQYLLLALIMFFVISGYKRGAILIGFISIIWFIYYANRLTYSSIGKFIFLLLSVILLYVGWQFLNHLYENSDYFRLRIERTLEGSASGREWVYLTFWNHYLDSDSYLHLIFGEGAFHTVNLFGLKAHNDWLELLVDCGILGVIVYSFYWYNFIRDWIRNRYDSVMYGLMGACLIYTLARTFFSMSFSDLPFYICMILGYCFAQCQNRETDYVED